MTAATSARPVTIRSGRVELICGARTTRLTLRSDYRQLRRRGVPGWMARGVLCRSFINGSRDDTHFRFDGRQVP